MSQPSEEPDKRPKRVSLKDLTPSKVEVQTSLGTLWLRHPGMTELARFVDIKDDTQRGREAVVVLANRVHEKRDRTPLETKDFDQLEGGDIASLASAIAGNCKWDKPTPATLDGLGRSALQAATNQLQDWSQTSKNLYKNIAGSYDFLKGESLATLQRQMDDVVRASSAFGHAGLLKQHEDLLREVDAAARGPLVGGAAAYLRSVAQEGKPFTVDAQEALRQPMERIAMPTFEESPLGKVTLESLQLNRTTATHTAQMASAVSDLQQTFVSVVFPQWSKSLQESQAGAEQTFRQAARSLLWTKWTLVASILVSLGVAWFQFSEGRQAGLDTAAQAVRSEEILRQQVELQRQALEQQASEATAMRESIDALRAALAAQTSRKSQ